MKYNIPSSFLRRRHFIGGLAAGAALLAAPALFAQERVRTPAQTEGPFYPDKLPLDTDNDLVMIKGAAAAALGEVTRLSGRILDARGNPVRNATVEIWQADKNGAYIHSRSGNAARRDANFQGFGRFETGTSGEYLFRTIKPVPYPGRAPHIHVAVKLKGMEPFITQCYVRGEPQNERDGVLSRIRDAKARASVIVPFEPAKGSNGGPDSGELAARFDIVLGMTPSQV